MITLGKMLWCSRKNTRHQLPNRRLCNSANKIRCWCKIAASRFDSLAGQCINLSFETTLYLHQYSHNGAKNLLVVVVPSDKKLHDVSSFVLVNRCEISVIGRCWEYNIGTYEEGIRHTKKPYLRWTKLYIAHECMQRWQYIAMKSFVLKKNYHSFDY